MIKQIKLTHELIRFSPYSSGKGRIVNKGFNSNEASFEAFFAYKILPNFAIFCQKRAANRLEHGVKRGFFGTDLLEYAEPAAFVKLLTCLSILCLSTSKKKAAEGIASPRVKRNSANSALVRMSGVSGASAPVQLGAYHLTFDR